MLNPQKLDAVLLNPLTGMIVFLILFWLIFGITYLLSSPLVEMMKAATMLLGSLVYLTFSNSQFPLWIAEIAKKGIVDGVGSVMAFLPSIFILFVLVYALEESGVLARFSALAQKMAGRFGLTGSFAFPFVLGLGCNVPAIMSAKTLRNEEKVATVIAIPFISCSARLPIYLLFAGTFFSENQPVVILLLYLMGIISAIATFWLFRNLLFAESKSKTDILLPNYRPPRLSSVFSKATMQTRAFVRKAGGVILVVSVIVWALTYPEGTESLGRKIGELAAPIFEPLGFGKWQPALSLLLGLAAKEAVIGGLVGAYSIQNGLLSDVIASDFSPASAFSFMVFVLLYTPCAPALAILHKECGTKMALLATAYYFVFAWAAAFMAYHAGAAIIGS